MTIPVATCTDLGDSVAAIADRLTDPAVIGASDDGRTHPQSLAGGAAGIALLHLERAVSGYGDEALAHRWIRAAAAGPVSTGPAANLFAGAPALALLLHNTATTLGGYQRAAAVLEEQTTILTRHRLSAALTRLDTDAPLTMREFDLIHGLTGLGVYHLRRHPDAPITRDILSYLVRLTAEREEPYGRPPWWLAEGLSGILDARFPRGHGNLGVAHGMSAATALLALAVLTGQHPPGAIDALSRLCAWFDQHRQSDDIIGASWWPAYVTDDPAPPTPHRPSWCYGTAGTARAQQLAGLALDDAVRCRRAEAAMVTAMRDPHQQTLLPEPGLCHGKGGLLQAAWRTATSSSSPDLASQLTTAIPQLADILAQQLRMAPPKSPELMDGAAGTALALNTAYTGAALTTWDAFLLLA
uniref:lanthionine synthetase C family protein n=1 Tax=Paractinoplanes polyasparticus TaxID=2856853 RepID=UPI001C85B794|nr:lanthionine synthetase C family protein [Actinoplanes polyasparticus]